MQHLLNKMDTSNQFVPPTNLLGDGISSTINGILQGHNGQENYLIQLHQDKLQQLSRAKDAALKQAAQSFANRLNQTRTALSKNETDLKGKASQLELEKKNIELNKDKLAIERNNLEERLRKSKEEQEMISQRFREHKDNLIKINEELMALKAKNEQACQTIQLTTRLIDNLTVAKNMHKNKLMEYQNRNMALMQQMLSIKKNLAEIEAQLQQTQTDLMGHESNLKQLESELSETRENFRQSSQELTEVNANRRQMAQAIQTIGAKDQEIQQSILQLKRDPYIQEQYKLGKLSEYEGLLMDNRSQGTQQAALYSAAASQLARLINQKEKMSQRMQQLNDGMQNLHQKISSSNMSLDQLNSVRQQLEDGYAKLMRVKEQNDQDKSVYQNKFDELQSTAAEHAETINQQRSQIDINNQEAAVQGAKYQDLMDQITRMKSNHEQIVSSQSQLMAGQEKLNKIEQRLAELERLSEQNQNWVDNALQKHAVDVGQYNESVGNYHDSFGEHSNKSITPMVS